jgi:hypothetical protein
LHGSNGCSTRGHEQTGARCSRTTRDLYPLHFGTFGGNVTRILWIIVGLAPAVLYVTGLLMWWNRSILPGLRRRRRRREMRMVEDAMIADPFDASSAELGRGTLSSVGRRQPALGALDGVAWANRIRRGLHSRTGGYRGLELVDQTAEENGRLT